ncbi:iron complex transport system permease protein [Micromonospora matsumotoense]|uniref:Iron complex transport system permease protein n=1 Tax=Micromonospora matsumotoense TaxID=121616 RepID=A0A1C4XM22_9ACTN|nr:iron chelate uptake ABC transporter family permease subunit [Micromonospora matsumotoense]SCF09517.1 iron complex transport system permease protein [Micromonospora matsumotoense]
MTTTTPARAAPPTTGRAARRRTTRRWLVGAVVVLLGSLVLSVFVGANPVPPADIWATLRGAGSDTAQYVVWGQRLPRTLAGLLVGAGLGVAGALMQAFTRNALAEPGILGVNAGAAAFVAAGIAFFGITSPAAYMWLALLGALLVAVAVYAVGGAADLRATPTRLLVTGVATGAVLAGLTTGITLTHPDTFDRMRGWNAGSLLERDTAVLLPVLPLIVAGLLAALLAASSLNALALGPDLAAAQGVSLVRTRLLVLGAVTLLAGGASAVAGPISFVGLVVPHLVRWGVGTDQRRILAGSLLAGGALVLLADVLGRIAVLPSEMPVGIVTAFVGAPVLIALARRRRATTL